jgi:hypothetical protein
MRRFSNSAGAKAVRRAELRAAAWRLRGHSAEGMDWPQRLHGQIAQAAAFCIGVDYETESVELMRAAGLARIVRAPGTNPHQAYRLTGRPSGQERTGRPAPPPGQRPPLSHDQCW